MNGIKQGTNSVNKAYLGTNLIMGGGMSQFGNIIDIQGAWNNFTSNGVFTVVNISSGYCQVSTGGSYQNIQPNTVKRFNIYPSGQTNIYSTDNTISTDAFYSVTQSAGTTYNKVTNVSYGQNIVSFQVENEFKSGFAVIYDSTN